jgi:hypothetical protein
MKLVYALAVILFFIACNQNNTNTVEVLLQPSSVITKYYQTEQTIQYFTTIQGKELNTYVKYMNEYKVTYTPTDSNVNLDLVFTNYRAEYEDGDGVQVFDTKFDKPDFVRTDTRIFFVMKNKRVSALVSPNGTILQVKGIAPLKNQILNEYQSLGFDKTTLIPKLDSFLHYFIKKEVLEETLLFYTRKPVVKDSSYFVEGITKTPAFLSFAVYYTVKPASETKTLIAGRGYAVLKDAFLLQNENIQMVSKKQQAELFDEVQLDKNTGILSYRKMTVGHSDSIIIKGQPYPLRFIMEKELKEKKAVE